jgi:hypothetical protein
LSIAVLLFHVAGARSAHSRCARCVSSIALERRLVAELACDRRRRRARRAGESSLGARPCNATLTVRGVQRKLGGARVKPLAEDPVERYGRLIALTAPAPSAQSALNPDSLEPIIQAAGDQHVAQALAVSDHVALHSALTARQALPLVSGAMQGQAGPEAKAQAVSQALGGSVGATGTIELSDPVMLAPWARAGFACSLVVTLGACIVCITVLGKQSGTPGSAFVGLSITGVLALIGILVLVMGYKSVTIKGGPSTGGSS